VLPSKGSHPENLGKLTFYTGLTPDEAALLLTVQCLAYPSLRVIRM
jgi:hypothetical protein